MSAPSAMALAAMYRASRMPRIRWNSSVMMLSSGRATAAAGDAFGHIADRRQRGGLVGCGREGLARGQDLLGAFVAGFVVLGILVDAPGVVQSLAGENVLDRQHRGHHRMVLVVVAMHSVAADEVQRRVLLLQLVPHCRDIGGISLVIDRI